MTDELLKYVGEENIYGIKLGVFGNKEQPLYSANDFARAIGYCHAAHMRLYSQDGMVKLKVKTKQGTPTPMWLITKAGIDKILSEKKKDCIAAVPSELSAYSIFNRRQTDISCYNHKFHKLKNAHA